MTLVSDITTEGMGKLRLTFQFVFFGILGALLGAVLVMPYAAEITGGTYWGLVIAEFAVLFAFFFYQNIITYLTFTFLTGVTLVPVLAHYLSAGAGDAIVTALLGTTMITSGLTFYASTTKKNYLGIGQILFWLLLALIVMMIANIFIGSSLLALGLSYVAVVLFSFFIIHDVQEVLYTDISPLQAAMGIYLDILNLFVHLLHILGVGGDD